MQVVGITRVEDYIERLQKDADELNLLFRDLLIGVTNFFRDPEAFEAWRNSSSPGCSKTRGRPIRVRVWVPGCATGEEVYSLADPAA